MDLSTTYMGLKLRCPLMATPGPIQSTVDGVKALSDAGAGAITMFSLFEEQIQAAQAREVALTTDVEEATAEALTYLPQVPVAPSAGGGPDAARSYLQLLEQAVAASDVPVIASLNGSTLGGWASFAKRMEEAGAAGIELNIYHVPGDSALTSLEVENLHIDIVGAVKAKVSIPVAVKLSPHFSSFAAFAPRLVRAGADALVLFSRFFQPDLDLNTMRLASSIELSRPYDARLPLTWIATLRRRLSCSLAASSGVEGVDEVVKYLLAGADVVGTTSALVRHGPGRVRSLVDGLEAWLERQGFASVADAKATMAASTGDGAPGMGRDQYFRALDQANGSYGRLSAL